MNADKLSEIIFERKKVFAPMPGVVHSILLKEGAHVDVGEPVIILEAMKMENEIESRLKGIIKKIYVKEGQYVATQEPLFEIL